MIEPGRHHTGHRATGDEMASWNCQLEPREKTRHLFAMTADEVIATVAAMPSADWLKIQAGLAEMVASRFSHDDVSEIRTALAEADAEFARGEAMTGAQVRQQLGLA